MFSYYFFITIKNTTMIDEEIYTMQNRDAFACYIYHKYHSLLEVYAFALCKRFRFDLSYADDILQELYQKILVSPEVVIEGYTQHGCAYLMGMLYKGTLSLNRKFKSRRRLLEVQAEHAPTLASVSHISLIPYIEETLQDMAQWLSERDLDIMKRYIEGYSQDEIGQELGMNSSTVGVRIHRAKKILKPLMG